MKTEYRIKLPHIQPVGATFFVTFRLYESIPYSMIVNLKTKYTQLIENAKKITSPHSRNYEIFILRKKYLVEYENLLHDIKSGPMYMGDPEIMKIVKTEIERFDNDLYRMLAYSIMANHVHILIDTSIQLEDIKDDDELEMNYKQLDQIMKRIKGPSAWYANKHLQRNGKFWDRESYDIYIRNEKMLNNVITYILENPVKAKMVEHWEAYDGNYLKMG